MKKSIKNLLVVSVLSSLFLLSACGLDSESTSSINEEPTKVTYYGWGGDENVNQWIDGYVTDEVLEKYNIELTRVGMNIEDILVKLLNEKQANDTEGDIDIVWINGENFNLAKQYGVLQPFTDDLTNLEKYVDTDADYVNYDFNIPIEKLEAPWGLSQLMFVGETAVIDDLPTSTEELLEVAKAHPGTITYPAPPDFTGSAFVRNVIYDIVGYDAIANCSNDKEEIKEVIMPALDYLNELEPYLWEEGKTYPKDEAVMQKMYSDGQLNMTMSYTALLAPRNIEDGVFSPTSEMFMFDKGNIGNSHYLAIPFNAPNYEGAVQVIDFMLSPKAQTSKLDIQNWGDLSVLDYNKLDDEQKEAMDTVNDGYETIDSNTLMENRLPEVGAEKVTIIEELWEEYVLNN